MLRLRTEAWQKSRVGLKGQLVNCSDSLGQIGQVFLGEAGHVGAPRTYHVNTEFIAQTINLFRLESSVGEHAALLTDAGKFLFKTVRFQRFDKITPQRVDAVAHFGELFAPHGRQLGGMQNLADNCTAVRGRVGVVLPRHDSHLRAYIFHLFVIFGHHDQTAGTLAVNAKVLGAGAGNDHLVEVFGEQTHAIGVFFEPFAETLIGEVDERQQAALAHDFKYLLPLAGVQVEAGRVMTAGVKNNDIPVGNLLDCSEHALEIETVLGIDIGVLVQFDTGSSENTVVVWPGRIADPDPLAG